MPAAWSSCAALFACVASVASHEVRAHAAGALPLHVQHVEVDGRTHEIALAPGDDAQLVAARFCGQVGLEPTECNRLAEALRKSQPSRARVQASAGDEASVASSAAAENAEETEPAPRDGAIDYSRRIGPELKVNFRGVLHELYRYDGETLDAALTRFCRRTGAVAEDCTRVQERYRELIGAVPVSSSAQSDAGSRPPDRPSPSDFPARRRWRAAREKFSALVVRWSPAAMCALLLLIFHMQQRDEEPG